jgi:hypothetical protein
VIGLAAQSGLDRRRLTTATRESTAIVSESVALAIVWP